MFNFHNFYDILSIREISINSKIIFNIHRIGVLLKKRLYFKRFYYLCTFLKYLIGCYLKML